MLKKLKRNISIWWIQSEKRAIFAMKWWCWWSNQYQKIERTFMKTDKSKLKKWVDEKRKFKNISEAWKTYCDENNLEHYGSDPWYMLFDVISAPERIMVRKHIDCDDYSLLSYNYFGNYINDGDSVYEFDGFYSIIWNEGNGHSIAIWKNMFKPKSYIMVSNDELVFIKDVKDSWNKINGGVKWLAKYKLCGKKLIFKGIVG